MRFLWKTISVGSLLLASQVNAEQERELLLRLAVDVKANRTLQLKAIVENATGKPLSVSMSAQNPPFRISIFDQHGVDLYQWAYESEAKSGKSVMRSEARQNTRLDLRPQEVRQYAATVEKVFLHGLPNRRCPMASIEFKSGSRPSDQGKAVTKPVSIIRIRSMSQSARVTKSI